LDLGEVVKMKHIPDKRCLICDEVISNPICTDCINAEIKDWLLEREIELIEDNNVIGSTICCICGKNIDICPSCYTNDLYSMIKTKYPHLQEQFKTYFNFELKHNIVE
jgi:hypothetical protein